MFKVNEFNKYKTKSTLKAFDFEINLKVTANYINTDIYFNDLVKKLISLTVEALAIHSNKIYFPEMIIYV